MNWTTRVKELFGLPITDTEVKNARFERMTPEQRRVAIAKDVIAQIRADRYRVTTGEYFTARDEDGEPLPRDRPEVVDDDRVRCDVCAIGSIMASGVRLFNREHTLRYSHHVAAKYFSSDQRALIECAFETSRTFADRAGSLGRRHPLILEAVNFGRSFALPSERLEAIMRNVIHNGGEFAP